MPRGAKPPLLAVAALAGGLVLVWLAAYVIPGGHWADGAALSGFLDLRGERSEPVARLVAGLADPGAFALLGAALVLVAAARGRYRLAAALPVMLVGANATTQVLKPALADPRITDALGAHISAASWPSGHSTAAMTLALGAVLVAAPRWRPAAAVAGAVFAVAVAYALLTLGWHYPSDVFGGYLVAALWTALLVAALRAADARWPHRHGREAGRAAAGRLRAAVPAPATALAAAGAAAVLGAAAVAAWRPGAVVFYLREHTVFTLGAPLIAMLALALATGLAAALRR